MEVGLGNYGLTRTEGAVTLPIKGDEFSVRLAGSYEKRKDGYYKNPFAVKDAADLEYSYGLRGTARWEPEGAPLVLTVVGDVSQYKDNGIGVAIGGINTGLPFGPGVTLGTFFAINGLNPNDYLYRPGVNFNETYGGDKTGNALIDTPKNTGTNAGVAGTLDLDLGPWRIRSISAWRKADIANAQDLDGMPIKLIAYGTIGKQTQISQELQASGSFGKFEVTTGAYYFREKGTEQSDSDVFGIFGLPQTRDLLDFKSTSRALFGQVNYHITEQLRATGGYRYTWDTRFLDRHGLAVIGPPAVCGVKSVSPTTCSEPHKATFKYPAWTVGLDYTFNDDLFVYVKSSSASKAGGFNARGEPPRFDFQPERVTDIEMGVKADFLDNRLQANVAVFRADGRDVQRIANIIAAGRTVQYTTNTGDTRTTGVEVELTARPWRGMLVNVGSAFMDGHYKAGTFIDDLGPLGKIDRSGSPLPQTPEWTFSIGATQTFEMATGRLSLHADYAYTDDKVIESATPGPFATASERAMIQTSNDLLRLDSYGMVGARATFTANTGVSVSIWGRNLTNEETFSYAFDSYLTLGFVPLYQQPPRTYGVDLKYAF